MSLQEVLIDKLGQIKNISVDNIKIHGDMLDELDGINVKYFNQHQGGTGNMNFRGEESKVNYHYKSLVNSNDCVLSSIYENETDFTFENKSFSQINNITANSFIVNSGTSNQLLCGDGSLKNIDTFGNIKYTPTSGNIGAHYQQSSLDGKLCIESNLYEDVNNFYFSNRNLKDIDNINSNSINTNNITTNSIFSNSILNNVFNLDSNGLKINNTEYKDNEIISNNQLIINAPSISTNCNISANGFSVPGFTNQYVLLADGTTGPYNSGGGQGGIYQYQNDTSYIVPPSTNGHINFDNVNNLASVVYINHMTLDSVDIDVFLKQIIPNDILYIQDKNNSLNWVKYIVLSTIVYDNQYTKIFVSYLESEGTGATSFGINHQIFFSILINQNLINQRLTTLETKTRYISSNILNETLITNTLNTELINTNNIYKRGVGEYITFNDADLVYLKKIDEANKFPITLLNSGTGSSLINSSTNPNFTLKSLVGLSGISLNTTDDLISISNTNVISLSDQGSGLSIIGSLSNPPNYKLKTFSNGSGISLNNNGANIEIVNNSPLSDLSISNASLSGVSILNTTTNPYKFKSLVAGSNCSIIDNNDYLTINSSSQTVNLLNGGSGLSLVSSTSAYPNLANKSISQGVGIQINNVSNNLELVNSSPLSNLSISSSGSGSSLWNSLTNPNYISKSILAGNGISISSTSTDITITNNKPSTDITLSNAGTVSLVNLSSVNPTLKLNGLVAGSNITLSTVGNDIQINATGSWSQLGYEYQPSNMTAGGQITIGTQAYYKSEWMPCSFTISSIRYFKLNTSSTTISFALYNSAGALLRNAINHTSTTQGINEVSFNSSYLCTKGERLIVAHSCLSSLSTLVFGVGLSSTNIPSSGITLTTLSTPYFYNASWSAGIPTNITTVSFTSTCFMWYVLF